MLWPGGRLGIGTGIGTYSAGVMAEREAGGRNVLRWCYISMLCLGGSE